MSNSRVLSYASPKATPASNTSSASSSTSSTTKDTAVETLQKLLNSTATTNYSETGTETGTVTTDNMDPTTRAAYEHLVGQLQGGGSDQQRTAAAALASLLQRSQAGEQQWTQDAARQQAQQGQALYTQNLRETLLPQINAAMEASGLSGDALNALLSQDAAARTAAQASAAEADLITRYGALSQAQQGVTAGVAGQMQNDPVMQLLVNALQIGKGSLVTETRNLQTTKQGTQTVTTNGSETSIGSTNKTSSVTGQQNTSGNDLAAMITALAAKTNSEANTTNAATNAAAETSTSLLARMQALDALQKAMPSGQNILGGLTVANSPSGGNIGALTLGGGATQTNAYSGLANLLSALGLRAN